MYFILQLSPLLENGGLHSNSLTNKMAALRTKTQVAQKGESVSSRKEQCLL